MGNIFKKFEKQVIRPVAHGIKHVGHQLEQNAIRPVAHGMRNVGHAVEKRSMRPIARRMKHVGHQLEQEVRGPAKSLLPIAAAVVGNMLGGPAVGTAAGALARAGVNRHHGSFGKNLFQGAGIGLTTSLGMNALGSGFGGLGKGLGGLGGLGQLASNLGLPFMGPQMMGGPQQQEMSPMGGLLDNLSDLLSSNQSDNLLMGAALAGSLLGKNNEAPPQKSIEDLMMEAGYGPKAKILRAREKGPGKRLRQRTGPGDTQFFEEINPELEYYYEDQPQAYAEGGYVDGDDSGISDKVPIKLKPGAFVLNGMDLSLAGDGNSIAGAKMWKKFADKHDSGFYRAYHSGGLIDAKVSPGELILEPNEVTAIGRGSNKRGSQIIEKTRRNLRKHKGVEKIVLPKTKPLERYMGGRK